MKPATKIRQTTERRRLAELRWRLAIKAAHEAGLSMRTIAAEAGISHEQVRRIINEGKS